MRALGSQSAAELMQHGDVMAAAQTDELAPPARTP